MTKREVTKEYQYKAKTSGDEYTPKRVGERDCMVRVKTVLQITETKKSIAIILRPY